MRKAYYPKGYLVKCFVCGCPVDLDDTCSPPEGPTVDLPPWDAIGIETTGNWGSKALDQERASFVICDKCFLERVDRVIVEVNQTEDPSQQVWVKGEDYF